jgi:hypothetical protein
LTFRAAISKSNASYYQQVSGAEIGVQAYYVSQYRFLAAALAFMVFSAFTIVSLPIGWWHLGRVVLLSPIEIAKAFGPLMFRDSGSNSDVDRLLKTVGSRLVQYGAVAVDRGNVSEEPPKGVQKDLVTE